MFMFMSIGFCLPLKWKFRAADDLFHRHRVNGDVGAGDGQLDVVGVVKRTSGRDRCQVARERIGIHRDDDLVRLPPGGVSILAGAYRVPGGQALDVRGKKVLARNRDAHLKDRSQNGRVCRRTA
jgi:hypothetical protein